jgi:hypothetical protein
MKKTILAVVLAAATTTPALAVNFQPLRDDPTLAAGLRWIAAADMIRNECPELEEATWRSLGFARQLLNRAFDLGYSFGEARAYVDDPTEQARVKGEARAYLRQAGVPDGASAAQWCAAGRTEMARSSQIGVLLRER